MHLMLAARTVVGSTPAQNDSADWSLAYKARLAGTKIYLMFQLKESPSAIRIHVIGNGRPAKCDGLPQHRLDGSM